MAELTREVLVKAEPSTIFALLIEPGLQSWLGTDVEFDARPGGIYKVRVRRQSSTRWASSLKSSPNERVVFTFGWDEPGHPIPAGSTKVAITLIPEGDETRGASRAQWSTRGRHHRSRERLAALLGPTRHVAVGGELVDTGIDRCFSTEMTPTATTWRMIHAERTRVADMLESPLREQWTADTSGRRVERSNGGRPHHDRRRTVDGQVLPRTPRPAGSASM